MTKARRSTPPKPPRRIVAALCAASRSRTRGACGVPSQGSRVERGSSSSSTSAPIAACSWRPPLPATWLAGLLFLALAIALLPGALVALFVLAAAALALLLIAALGSSAVACKRDAMIAAMIDVAVRHVSPATASRASSGREHPLRQPLAR
jgi:hypothetical protein